MITEQTLSASVIPLEAEQRSSYTANKIRIWLNLAANYELVNGVNMA